MVGKIITTTSMKGGVGKTETSLNLAAALRKTTGKRTIIVDFDIPYGGVAQALALHKESSISDWIRTNRLIGEEAIRTLVIQHSSGIDVLPAIASVSDLEKFNADVAQRILSQLAKCYDFVVVDSGVDLSPITRVALTSSDHVVMITTPHNVSIWNNHQYKEDLIKLGVHPDRIILFLNKVERNSEIDVKEVIRVFTGSGVAINTVVTANQEPQIQSIRNYREFVYLKKPNSTFSVAIQSILEKLGILPRAIVESQQKWSISKLFKRRMFG